MSHHYDHAQAEAAVQVLLERLKQHQSKDPQDLACVRAMEALAPTLMRFQINEMNSGYQADHTIAAMMEMFAWWVHHLARNATRDKQAAEEVIMHMGKHIVMGAVSRLDGETMATIKGERGGRA